MKTLIISTAAVIGLVVFLAPVACSLIKAIGAITGALHV